MTVRVNNSYLTLTIFFSDKRQHMAYGRTLFVYRFVWYAVDP